MLAPEFGFGNEHNLAHDVHLVPRVGQKPVSLQGYASFSAASGQFIAASLGYLLCSE